MQLQNKLFVAGEFVEAEARGRIEVFNPHDNSKIADVAEARQADIDKAVAGLWGITAAEMKFIRGMLIGANESAAAAKPSSRPKKGTE